MPAGLPLPPVEFSPGLAIATAVVMLAALFLPKLLISRGYSKALIYFPEDEKLLEVEIKEVEPGIWVSKKAKYVAIIPPDTKKIQYGKEKYFLLYRLGSILVPFNIDWSLKLRIVTEGLEETVTSAADLIAKLYRRKIVQKNFPFRPDLEIALGINARELAAQAALVYDKSYEHGITSLAVITGKNREFQDYVRMVEEMRERQASRIEKLLWVVGLIIIAIVAIGLALGHGGG